MPTLRQDPTTNEWVIVAPARAQRPHSHPPRHRPVLEPRDPGCPFCPGNESLTPPEILRRPDRGNWEIRVIPNLYPALEMGGDTERYGDAGTREMDGVGYHEVVVESPRHDQRPDEMAPDHLARVLASWRDRYRVLREDPAVKSIIVFKNFGEGAGTSLIHPHAQILATPVFPPDALHRYAVATRYYDDTGHSVFTDLVEQERTSAARIVAVTDEFIVFEPFAARLPFETWIVPLAAEPSFDRLDDDRIPGLASLVRAVLGALRRAAGDPDYNLVLDSAPVLEESKPFYLWHLRLLPRMTTPAGFELATGMSINTVAPEDSARLMREALRGAEVG